MSQNKILSEDDLKKQKAQAMVQPELVKVANHMPDILPKDWSYALLTMPFEGELQGVIDEPFCMTNGDWEVWCDIMEEFIKYCRENNYMRDKGKIT
jgi:hypothetical protein|tara:strand:- start:1498 stop:1785 length:288 start_codon:yes stop_codon:yes gene_type:complete